MDTLTVKNATFYTKYDHSDKSDKKPFEKFLLNGTYTIKEYCNTQFTTEELDEIVGINIFHCKNPFYKGNILLKTNEPGIEAMIQLIIRSSCEIKKLPDYLDTSKANKVQMVGGTICPTKEEIFRYEGQIYYLYGRYIYGYNQLYVLFKNENQKKENYNSDDEDESNDDDGEFNDEDSYEEYKRRIKEDRRVPDKVLSIEKIILPEIIDEDGFGSDYNYSFLIEKEDTNELVAFGIYK